ncbi:hypothetical protein CPG38_06215 [Malaciobacter marinus]|uniref:hypothetical protein n=1 Tax=Malaciobacter marinus TaxID=505249 RepID=UPI000C07F227|nr:hypothetical protein [Malaciobacter marinus]PHO12665.1 hypothetical protein CPG38_06215 [Malaciobacter marinus]
MKEKEQDKFFFISIETLTKKKKHPYYMIYRTTNEKIYFLPLRENKTYLKDIIKFLTKKLVSKTINISFKVFKT